MHFIEVCININNSESAVSSYHCIMDMFRLGNFSSETSEILKYKSSKIQKYAEYTIAKMFYFS